jgi:hypothetical protein
MIEDLSLPCLLYDFTPKDCCFLRVGLLAVPVVSSSPDCQNYRAVQKSVRQKFQKKFTLVQTEFNSRTGVQELKFRESDLSLTYCTVPESLTHKVQLSFDFFKRRVENDKSPQKTF